MVSEKKGYMRGRGEHYEGIEREDGARIKKKNDMTP